jgi:hypothetical protein
MVVGLLATLLAAPAAADEAIFEHLAHAEEVLRAADTGHLSPAQRAARAANLDRLHHYRLQRRLPRNLDHPGQRVPYFIDDQGVPCAMAHLVIASGHATAARAIAARENNAYLLDMRSPELSGWLATSGLTAQEAAFIQPTYEFYCTECEEEPEDEVCGEDGKIYANACWAEKAGVLYTQSPCLVASDPLVGVCNEGGITGFVPKGGCSAAGAATPSGAGPAAALLLLVLLLIAGRRGVSAS